VLRPWLHGAIIECFVCVCALVSVSLLTKRPPETKLSGTTVEWGSIASSAEARPSVLADYRLWLTVLVSLTAFLWWWMR